MPRQTVQARIRRQFRPPTNSPVQVVAARRRLVASKLCVAPEAAQVRERQTRATQPKETRERLQTRTLHESRWQSATSNQWLVLVLQTHQPYQATVEDQSPRRVNASAQYPPPMRRGVRRGFLSRRDL